jgi:hypothetical protein
VDFENVLDPLEGDPLEKIDREIRKFAFDKLTSLLREARRKCPNALMILSGYFLPISRSSDRSQLKRLLEFLSGEPGFKLAVNNFLTSPLGMVHPLGILGAITGKTKDVDALVSESIQRAEFAFGRGLFWLRRAVTELFESELRGPGILFAHPGFGPQNALFGAAPFLHQGYRKPDADDHAVKDAVLAERVAKFPRLSLLQRLVGALNLVAGPAVTLPDAEVSGLRQLRNDLDGPTSLREALTAVVTKSDLSSRAPAAVALEKEIGNLKMAQIASFVHPNEAGARRYADVIVERYTRYQKQGLKADLRKLGTRPAGTLSVKQSLRRYGLDPTTGLRACLQHVVVDSLAIETITERVVMPPPTPGFEFPGFPLKVSVGPDRQFTMVNPIRQFAKAGARDLFTIDTSGTLHLGDIDQFVLEIEQRLGFGVELSSVTLFVNGKMVFQAPRSAAAKDGDRLVFRYPG